MSSRSEEDYQMQQRNEATSNQQETQQMEQQPRQQFGDLWELSMFFASIVMANPAGRAAAAALPELPWLDIMGDRLCILLTSEKGPECVRHAPILVDEMGSWVIWKEESESIEPDVLDKLTSLVAEERPHPLHAAALSTHVAHSYCAALLANGSTAVERGAAFDCDVLDGQGRSALHWASFRGRVGWVSALILAGAEVDRADAAGVSSLHLAAGTGFVDATKALLAGGADKDMLANGMSPLFLAVSNGHTRTVEALCAAGADTELANQEDGRAPLHQAAIDRNTDTVKTLLAAGADVDCPCKLSGKTPLHLAAMGGAVSVIRVLCEAGAKLEIWDTADGFTPLLSAAAVGKLEGVEVLLECGASVESESSLAMLTPLMIASLLNHVVISRALLKAGANARRVGLGDLTALHLASEKGHAPVVEELLRAGADPNARVKDPPPRSTPLHSACRSSRLSSVVALLRGGADETMEDFTPAKLSLEGVMQAAVWPGNIGGGDGHGSDDNDDAIGDDENGNRPPCPLGRPSTRPIDLVGWGRFFPEEDPEQRNGLESDEEHARRRDPATLELIRDALRRAPFDRRWHRRSWLVMLLATVRWQSSSSSEVLSLERGLDEGGRASMDGLEKEGVDEEVSGKGKGKSNQQGYGSGRTPASKRSRAGVGEVSTASEEVAADRRGGDDDSGGNNVLGSSAGLGKGAVWGDGEYNAEEALRCTCFKLFELADVEEGAFRRVVSYL